MMSLTGRLHCRWAIWCSTLGHNCRYSRLRMCSRRLRWGCGRGVGQCTSTVPVCILAHPWVHNGICPPAIGCFFVGLAAQRWIVHDDGGQGAGGCGKAGADDLCHSQLQHVLRGASAQERQRCCCKGSKPKLHMTSIDSPRRAPAKKL